ncbi:hypothetical protein PG994_012608 [Apiospora phragmitis]|uniref:Uncharacterized protein n=1 Tax=Apiospora phragmitis TaxID=2905665 RepID=A0ABR1TAY0_9PEZI
MEISLESQAHKLVSHLASQTMTNHGFGSMSTSIYDTAWVSMIPNREAKTAWLFPESFSYATALDGILNTAAALLSLKKHIRDVPENTDWVSRSLRAERALCAMLGGWDMMESDQVGFELLVCHHLSLLHHEGVNTRFANMEKLTTLCTDKLARIPPSSVYKAPSTLLHSLEALTGHIDFDQVGRWRDANGSMMGSPSSTAAYLIHATTWDDEAEDYLRRVLVHGSGKGNGSVPSAWPTTVFEVTWVVATFAAVGLPIDCSELHAIGNFLQELMAGHHGTVGFSPSSLPDADDTAMTITALQHLGVSLDLNPLFNMFESETHFRTYEAERNPSISANCNVLICLLSRDDRGEYVPKILKALRFVCSQIMAGKHQSELYWVKLLSQAFSLLFRDASEVFRQNLLESGPELETDVVQVSLHVLLKIFQSQRPDGSWEGRCEVTAYAVLALASLSFLPWISQMRCAQLATSMEAGKGFLLAKRNCWHHGDYLWTEKVTYGCGTLSEAYCLAAAVVPSPVDERIQPPCPWADLPKGIVQGVQGARKLIQRTPLFQGTEPYLLDIAELLACYSVEMLEHQRHQGFSRAGLGEDKYLAFIPLTWTACGVLQRHPLSIRTFRIMMSLSMFNYQVDEYMEAGVANDVRVNLDDVRLLVDELFDEKHSYRSRERSVADGNGNAENPNGYSAPPVMTEEIRTTLGRYIGWVLQSNCEVASSTSGREKLSLELRNFLLAHVTQSEDNRRLASWKQDKSRGQKGDDEDGTGCVIDSSRAAGAAPTPKRSFYNWVRSTSADHTSCPFSFIFFVCLVAGQPGSHFHDAFAMSKTAYVLEDLCRHLASLCRMYNDYGSVSRDRAEANLNSVDFPEFQEARPHGQQQNYEPLSAPSSASASSLLEDAKKELMWIAEYERRGLNRAVAELEKIAAAGACSRELVEALEVFCNVTDLYGQIYVIRDIAARVS